MGAEGVDVLMISFMYLSAWLLLGCVSNCACCVFLYGIFIYVVRTICTCESIQQCRVKHSALLYWLKMPYEFSLITWGQVTSPNDGFEWMRDYYLFSASDLTFAWRK